MGTKKRLATTKQALNNMMKFKNKWSVQFKLNKNYLQYLFIHLSIQMRKYCLVNQFLKIILGSFKIHKKIKNSKFFLKFNNLTQRSIITIFNKTHKNLKAQYYSLKNLSLNNREVIYLF